MVIQFEKEYLRELYYDGRCDDKSYRFQPQIVRGYVKCIKILERVRSVEDLLPFHGLNYETLTGNKKGRSSVRINNQYRLEFEVATKEETDALIIKICKIIDITNHYR